MKRIASIAMGLLLCLGLITLEMAAQNQTQSSGQSSSATTSSSGTSLGDYARQIRKDAPATSKPKVYDNDNLPTDDKLSIVGQAPAATSDNSGAKADESANANSANTNSDASSNQPPKTAEQEQAEKQAAIKEWGDKIAGQKDAISLLSRELDVLQREYQLRAAAFYADAGNRLRNQADWDQQDAKYKQQIADKQKQLDDAKQKLDDMQEQARKAGVPSSVSEQ